MDIFFTGVGFDRILGPDQKGGKVCIRITITTIGLILGQDILAWLWLFCWGCTPPRPWSGLSVPDGRRGHLQCHRPLL